MAQLLHFLLLVALISKCCTVSIEEVKKMKDELEKEFKSFETQPTSNKIAEKDKQKKAKDLASEEVLKDLIRHDIQNSLKHLADNGDDSAEKAKAFFESILTSGLGPKEMAKASEKIATDFIKKLIEKENEGHTDDDNKILDKLLEHERKASVEVEKREDALAALEKLRSKDLEKKEMIEADRKANFAKSKLKGGQCEDKRKDCEILKEHCKLPQYKLAMKRKCPYTCRFCHKCKDFLPKETCKRLAPQCKVPAVKDRMKYFCYETCFCTKSQSPPACQNSLFGCCWNNVTKKIDKHGSNCPACVDRYESLCKNFMTECGKKNAPGKFMRQNCPQACGVCRECDISVDKPGFKELCLKWKKEGYCNVLDVGEVYCRHTCYCMK